MLLRITALAAVVAAAPPPFVTATALRPARRAQEECPVLTKIKKDDCTDVKDFDALPVSIMIAYQSARTRACARATTYVESPSIASMAWRSTRRFCTTAP